MSGEISDLCERGEFDVACVGGGPGSDFLGIMKYMIRKNQTSTITTYLYDKEDAWGESWGAIAKYISPTFNVYPVFQTIDLTNLESVRKKRKFLSADLFTFVYFLSEMHSFREQAEPCFNHIMESAKKGSYFLFIDNNNVDFTSWYDDMAEKNGIISNLSNERDMAFETLEEKKDLGDYFVKFGWPKRQSIVAYRLGTKR